VGGGSFWSGHEGEKLTKLTSKKQKEINKQTKRLQTSW